MKNLEDKKLLKIEIFIKKKRSYLLFYKEKFKHVLYLNWQKEFLDKNFFFLYFLFLLWVRRKSLKIFFNFLKIFFLFWEKRKILFIFKFLMKLRPYKLRWFFYFWNRYVGLFELWRLFKKHYFKLKKNKRINFIWNLFFYLKIKYKSTKYKLNKINDLFILFNLYFVDLYFIFIPKILYEVWLMFLILDFKKLVLFEKLFIKSSSKFFLKNFWTYKVFNIFFYKINKFLKSQYYVKIYFNKKIKKTYKKKTKFIIVTRYKKIYKFYELPFKGKIYIT